jgi:hypothetical protein
MLLDYVRLELCRNMVIKINFFRVMIGAKPNLTAAMAEQQHHKTGKKNMNNTAAGGDLGPS